MAKMPMKEFIKNVLEDISPYVLDGTVVSLTIPIYYNRTGTPVVDRDGGKIELKVGIYKNNNSCMPA